MSIAVVCPSCHAKLKAPEALVGKSVKCPNCATAVLIRAPQEHEPTAVSKAPAAKRPVVEELPEVEDAFMDEPPRRPAKAASIRRGPGAFAGLDEVDDVDEDRPPRRGRGAQTPGGPVSDNDKTMALLMYLSTFVVGWIGPLVMWLMKRQESRFIDYHGKQIFNMTVTVLLIFFVLMVFIGVGVGVGIAADVLAVAIIAGVLGGIAWFAVAVWSFVFTLIAALKAKNGEWYRVPMKLHLFK